MVKKPMSGKKGLPLKTFAHYTAFQSPTDAFNEYNRIRAIGGRVFIKAYKVWSFTPCDPAQARANVRQETAFMKWTDPAWLIRVKGRDVDGDGEMMDGWIICGIEPYGFSVMDQRLKKDVAGFSEEHQLVQYAGTPSYVKVFHDEASAQRFIDKYADAGYGLAAVDARVMTYPQK